MNAQLESKKMPRRCGYPCKRCHYEMPSSRGEEYVFCSHCLFGQNSEQGTFEIFIDHTSLEGAYGLQWHTKREVFDEARLFRCGQCGLQIWSRGSTPPQCALCPGQQKWGQSVPELACVPAAFLPFAIDRADAQRRCEAHVHGTSWFAKRFRADAALQAVEAIYLPYLAFSLPIEASYRGQVGRDYYETTTATNSSGTSETERVRHTKWNPSHGEVKFECKDITVFSSHLQLAKEVKSFDPWDLRDAIPFSSFRDHEVAIGHFGVTPSVHFERIFSQIYQKVAAAICEAMGGDEQKIENARASMGPIQSRLILIPYWISTYKTRNGARRYICDARIGTVSGDRSWATKRIARFIVTSILVAVGLVGLAALIWLFN